MRPLNRFARIAPVALACVALLAAPSGGVAATKVFGGTPVQIYSAPWAVFISQKVSTGSLVCSGSILDSLHVLTAAHCLEDNNGAQAVITSLSIKAGVSNYKSPSSGDAEQDRAVSSLRIHPLWVSGGTLGTPDDIAILALSQALDLSGPSVRAIALPAPGAAYPTGDLQVDGFGRESSAGSPDGSLNSLTLTAKAQDDCGGEVNAILLCTTSPAGAVCSGDSGAGLVATAGTPTLVGVIDTSPAGCPAGSTSTSTYVGAPEILQFVQGNDHPPTAPRVTSATKLVETWAGPLRVGNTLTCSSGDWTGAPAIAFAFVNTQDGSVLQQGAAATYVFKPADVGATVACTAIASNDGGTAVLSTTATTPIAAIPPLTIDPLAPVAAVRGKPVTVKVVLNTPDGLTGRITVCLLPSAGVGGKACAWKRIDAGSYGSLPFMLRLRIKTAAPVGASRLTITATSSLSPAQRTALVRVSRP